MGSDSHFVVHSLQSPYAFKANSAHATKEGAELWWAQESTSAFEQLWALWSL